MAERKKILIITSYFPPSGHIAAFRVGALAKYLGRADFSVTVIAKSQTDKDHLENYEGAEVHYLAARDLVRDLVARPAGNRWQHYFLVVCNRLIGKFCQDDSPSFTKKAIRLGEDLIEQNQISHVLTSFGPLNSLAIGLKLKVARPQLFWIADLRDELVRPENRNDKSTPGYKMEVKVKERADLILGVSKPILDDLAPDEATRRRCLEVRNGFDFAPITAPKSRSGSVLKLVYAGSFYGDRKPDLLFQVLKHEASEPKGIKIHLDIYGGNSGLEIPSPLRDSIRVYPRQPHKKMIELLQEYDAFLLVSPNDSLLGVYTGKLFDYLAVNRPILALINPDDVAADLIRSSNSGYVADSCNPEKIRNALCDLYKDWLAGELPSRNWAVVNEHHRERQIERLAQALDRTFVRKT